MMRKFRFLALFSLLMLITVGILAQESDSCKRGSALADACGDMEQAQVCYGAGTLSYTGTIEAEFDEAGDRIDLKGVESVSSDEQDGALTMTVPAGEDVIHMTLIGAGIVKNMVQDDPDNLLTLTIKNRQPQAVNLREGPGIDYPIAGVFAYAAEAVADGRTEDQKWLRAQTDSGTVWIFSNLVRVLDEDKTLQDLAVVNSLYSAPMMAIELSTAADERDCGKAGLLVQYQSETTGRMNINGVDFVFDDVTMQVQAQADETMRVSVLDGDAELRFEGIRTAVRRGSATEIALGGDSGLQAIAQPEIENNFAFADVSAAPVSLFGDAETNMCLVGVDAETDLLYLPREDANTVLTMTADEHYRATGQTRFDDENISWLKVRSGSSVQGWIPQDQVQTAGLCAAIPEIDSATVFNVVTPGSFVPVGQSIWTANSGTDQVSGTCIYPPLAICNHLVAISANPDGSISWRGQEPEPYRMAKVTENEYSYAGRNKLGNASMSLYLRFNSSTSWGLTMTQVFDNDPECTHTFSYSAVPR